MKRPVVSNTSPLIALAKIDQIGIVRDLFGKIYIPESVSGEFLSNCAPDEKKGFEKHIGDCILIVKAIKPARFARKLGDGETDALSLAMEMGGVLIIDDKKGRNEAKDQGVDAISTRAMLKIAEEKKIIRDFLEMEEALKQKRFFIPPYE